MKWLKLLIKAEIDTELEGMNERTQAQRIQEAYRASQSIAMRRCVDRIQSPLCPREVDTMRAHFSAASKV
jgi:hypothetical protein